MRAKERSEGARLRLCAHHRLGSRRFGAGDVPTRVDADVHALFDARSICLCGPGGVIHEVRRLCGQTDVLGQAACQQVAEAAGTTPGGADRLLVAQHADAAVGQRFERHRRIGGAHELGNLGEDLVAQCLNGSGARQGLRLGTSLVLVRQLSVDEQREQVSLADLRVADRRVRRRRVIVGKDHRAPGVRAQAVQHWREVGIGRKDHELVEVGVVGEQVAHIHHHTDVGRVLQLRREGRAVDHLEAGAQEVMAHERERAHVGGIVALVPARDRIAVAAIDDDAALRVEGR